MLAFLKKPINYLIGKGPRAVVNFSDFLSHRAKICYVDTPENLTGIIKQEQAKPLFYKSFNNYFNADFSYRITGSQPRYKEGGLFPGSPQRLYSLDSGAIWGHLGIIYHPGTRLVIAESAMEWLQPLKKNSLFSSVNLKPIIRLKGVALSLCTTGADGGFFHFLHEALPKLAFCIGQTSYVDYFLVSGVECEWKLKFLTQVGLDLNKVIWMQSGDHYQFDQLLFTNRLMVDQQFNTDNITGLKYLVNYQSQPSGTKDTKIIWVSRAGEHQRNLQWENLIKDRYPSITVVNFESLTVAETMEFCASCNYFIGPHGAGFSNLLFCKPGTVVLELFSDENYQPLYYRLSQTCGLEHYATRLNFTDADNTLGFKYFIEIFESLLTIHPVNAD